MKTHTVKGGDDTSLNVVETGNPRGRPILFIHGLSQCWLSWSRQLDSELAEDFRLVALDIRGHGESDKPRDAYGESKSWADDVNAVIQSLNLDRPIVCGWSYGPLLILDYLRHYGEDGVSGINFIGGVTRLGDEEAASVLTEEFLALMPGFVSSDVEESVRSLGTLLRLCFTSGLSDADWYRMLGYSVRVPPHVREGMFARSIQNKDLLSRLKTPVLITHGDDDAVVRTEVIDRQMSSIPDARVEMMAGAGHACFWNDPSAYNRLLGEFAGAA